MDFPDKIFGQYAASWAPLGYHSQPTLTNGDEFEWKRGQIATKRGYFEVGKVKGIPDAMPEQKSRLQASLLLGACSRTVSAFI